MAIKFSKIYKITQHFNNTANTKEGTDGQKGDDDWNRLWYGSLKETFNYIAGETYLFVMKLRFYHLAPL